MAESTLSITRSDLLRAVGRFLGGGRDATAWKPEFRADVNDVVDIGCRTFYHPPVLTGETQSHDWSFLKPVMQNFTINAAYATGTIAVTAGVVELSGVGAEWPSWAADGQIEVDGRGYSVATRTDDDTLILDDLSTTIASGTLFSLTHIDPQLPDLWGGFAGDLVFSGDSHYYQPVIKTSMSQILQWRQESLVSSFPQYYAIQQKSQTGASPQRHLLSIWPSPDGDYTLTAPMIINPYQLTADLPYQMGGMPFHECLREACLAAAETEIVGEAGLHSKIFMRHLQSAVSFDRQTSKTPNLGSMNKGGMSYKPWVARDYIRDNSTSVTGYV